jgi:Domain of unknown function (DUF1707)
MPNTYSHRGQPQQTRDRSLRAGDLDRDAVADVLREQHLAGRLESDEFQQRLDRCYAAKTYGELDELVADLPAQEPPRRVRRPSRWPALALLPLLIAVIALSHSHLPWLAIPVLIFGVRPLLWRSVGRRPGWGLIHCGIDRSTPPVAYV